MLRLEMQECFDGETADIDLPGTTDRADGRHNVTRDQTMIKKVNCCFRVCMASKRLWCYNPTSSVHRQRGRVDVENTVQYSTTVARAFTYAKEGPIEWPRTFARI